MQRARGKRSRNARTLDQRLQPLAAQQPARVDDDPRARRGQGRARDRGALVARRGTEARQCRRRAGCGATVSRAKPRGHALVARSARDMATNASASREQSRLRRRSLAHRAAPASAAVAAACPRCRPRPTSRRSPPAAGRPACAPARARHGRAGRARACRAPPARRSEWREPAQRRAGRAAPSRTCRRGPRPAGPTRRTRDAVERLLPPATPRPCGA